MNERKGGFDRCDIRVSITTSGGWESEPWLGLGMELAIVLDVFESHNGWWSEWILFFKLEMEFYGWKTNLLLSRNIPGEVLGVPRHSKRTPRDRWEFMNESWDIE